MEEGAAAPFNPTSSFVDLVTFVRIVVQISQQRRKVTDGVSVVSPNNQERLTFLIVWADKKG